MNISDMIADKKVTIFGLGLNHGGVGTVRFVVASGAREIVVTDAKTAEELAPSIAALANISGIIYHLGGHVREDFIETDLVIKTPGVRWDHAYIQAAEAVGIPVVMDSSLFFQYCPCPIVGVTGTKGKTTTATLITHLLAEAGRAVVQVGSEQVPVLGALSQITPESLVVFELSSWRLSGLARTGQSPHIAVFTNFFPDHLNYYASMDEYYADKRAIFAAQTSADWLVYDVGIERLAIDTVNAQHFVCSEADSGYANAAFLREGAVWVRIAGTETRLIDLHELHLPGAHNRRNVLLAVGAACVAGVDEASIRRGLATFSGVPNRCEWVRDFQGVRYFNDTTATVPEAAMLALESFVEPLVWLGGGADKQLNFAALAQVVAARVKRAILFHGAATDKLVASLAMVGYPADQVMVVDSMVEALSQAQRVARVGDVVLLSPGAASFGVFQNEFDRGTQFREQVQALGA